MNPTVARLPFRGLLGRRRALLLVGLPLLLIVISAAVRGLAGQDHELSTDLLAGFALASIVPLVGVIAGTGAIGPEIDDGSIVYLLAKPVPRPRVIVTKLMVAVGCTIAFAAVPTFLAALILSGTAERIAVGYGAAAVFASVAYGALFLLLGVVSRHAVVIGLIYAMVWESVVGSLVEGAKNLSVQQWALSVAERIAGEEYADSAVGMPTGVVLLAVVSALATWYAGQRLRSLTLAGEE